MAKFAKLFDELHGAIEGFVQRAFDEADARTAKLEERIDEVNRRAPSWQRVEALEKRVAALEALKDVKNQDQA